MSDYEALIENRLQDWMRPVQPRPGFIEQLRSRLARSSPISLEPKIKRTPGLVVLSGALIGICVYSLIKWLISTRIR